MEAEIQQAKRYIQAGKARIARQHALIAQLRADGYAVADAENLLRVLTETLVTEYDHLATLLYEQEQGRFTPR